MVSIPLEHHLEPRQRIDDHLLIHRKEARKWRSEIQIVIEAEHGAIDNDALGIGELNIEAAAEIQAAVHERALPLEPEDTNAVVVQDPGAVAVAAQAAAKRTAGADGLIKSSEIQPTGELANLPEYIRTAKPRRAHPSPSMPFELLVFSEYHGSSFASHIVRDLPPH